MIAKNPTPMPPGIVIDKEINYGLPRLEQSNIGTHAIRDRFTAGECIVDIAADYGIPQSEVEQALRYELSKQSPESFANTLFEQEGRDLA